VKGSQCSRAVTLYQAGARVAPPSTCFTSDSYRTHFAIGAELPAPAHLLGGLPAQPAGAGRMRLRAAETPAGAQAFTFWDATLGEDCYPSHMGGNVFRCLPLTNGFWELGFSDPQCTRPLALFYRQLTVCPSRRFAVYLGGTSTVVYPLGPPFAGPYYVGIQGSCVPGNETMVPYEVVGGPVPETDFVEVRYTVR
jgi:hypothetical protein